MTDYMKPRYPVAIALTLALAGGLVAFTAQHEGTGKQEVRVQESEIRNQESAAAFVAHVKATQVVVTHAYPDPGYGWKVPTICYGHTQGVKRGDVATLEQCEAWLAEDYERIVKPALLRYVTVEVTVSQATALADFVFNVGGGAFGKSTLVKKLNAGDCVGTADQFPRWNKSNGKVLKGLVTRRADERALFVADCGEV
jgi:lysozyme